MLPSLNSITQEEFSSKEIAAKINKETGDNRKSCFSNENEIILLIFKYLSCLEVFTTSPTCKQWYIAARTNSAHFKMYQEIVQKFQKELDPIYFSHHIEEDIEMNPPEKSTIHTCKLLEVKTGWKIEYSEIYSHLEVEKNTNDVDFIIYRIKSYKSAYKLVGWQHVMDPFYRIPLVAIELEIKNADLPGHLVDTLAQSVKQINNLIRNRKLTRGIYV